MLNVNHNDRTRSKRPSGRRALCSDRPAFYRAGRESAAQMNGPPRRSHEQSELACDKKNKHFVFGGAEGNRTPDLCSAIAALSHLSYGPATKKLHTDSWHNYVQT